MDKILNNLETFLDDRKETVTMSTGSPMEYVSIIQDLQRFRGSARSEGDLYDFPNQVFFKILFHFDNDSDANSGGPSATPALSANGGVETSTSAPSTVGTGLLHPTWLAAPKVSLDMQGNDGGSLQKKIEYLWANNTAWSYLTLQGEDERAHNLRLFIELLSNINTNTPWYFQNLKGLEQATNREMIGSDDFIMKPERNRITIECLEDAYDMRISTMLDLYRSAVWSWEMKREMVPSNLRKFDMTIIVFQMPIKGLNSPRGTMQMSEAIMRNETKIVETNEGFAVVYDEPGGVGKNVKLTSYKAWEFHGCEIDYNTTKFTMETVNNAEGTALRPQIDIFYDDCFEIRFNEFLGRHITDLIGDSAYMVTNTNCSVNKGRLPKEQPKVDVSNISDFKDANPSITQQIAGGLLSWGDTKLKKIYLGNLSGLSLSRIGQQLKELDDVGATVGSATQYIRGNYNGSRTHRGGDIFPEPEQTRLKRLGNIFTAKTRANS